MFLLLVKMAVAFSLSSHAQDCKLIYQRVKGPGQRLSNPNDAMAQEQVSLNINAPVKFETEWFTTSGKLGDGKSKFYGSHNRLLRNDGANRLKVTYSNRSERVLDPGQSLNEDGDVANVSCMEMGRDCKLTYQRVKGMGQSYANTSNRLAAESTFLKIGEVQNFETDWLSTQGKLASIGRKFGSHNRLLKNDGQNVLRVMLNVAPIGAALKPVVMEKILFPKDQMVVEADIAGVACDRDRLPLVNKDCSDEDKAKFSQWKATPFGKPIYEKESGVFSNFVTSSNKMEPINAYLLSKLTELIYEERIDFELKFKLRDDATTVPFKKTDDKGPSATAQLSSGRSVTNANMKCAFEQRTAHFFYDPKNPSSVKPVFKFFHRQHTVTLAGNLFFFQVVTNDAGNIQYTHDPELMVVITPQDNYLVWRGTDDVEGLTKKDGNPIEFLSTDFAVQSKEPENSDLKGTKVHAGIWDSFKFIEPSGAKDLSSFLMNNGGKTRRLWVTGHSLGAGQAILSAAYLKSQGFNVAGVYAFAAPRVLGDDNFKQWMDRNLADKVYRFEHSLDIVTTLWFPGYNMNIGKRFWFEVPNFRNERQTVNSKWVFKGPIREREFPYFPKGDSEEAKRVDDDMFNGDIITSVDRGVATALNQAIPILTVGNLAAGFVRYGYLHNPQFYVFGAYSQLSESERKVVPAPIDSFPYMYKDFGYLPNFGYK